jgi:hypothetical protein
MSPSHGWRYAGVSVLGIGQCVSVVAKKTEGATKHSVGRRIRDWIRSAFCNFLGSARENECALEFFEALAEIAQRNESSQLIVGIVVAFGKFARPY